MILARLRYLQAVGEWHGDAARNIQGAACITGRGISGASGAFSTGGYNSVTGIQVINDSPGWFYFDASKVIPTSLEFRTRTYAGLGCVCVSLT